MHREPTPSRGHYCLLPRLLLVVIAALACALPCQAQIDTTINLTVWKMLYGVTDAQANDAAWLARDDDGDGTTNGGELIAGTNPFDATSHPAVTTTTLSGGNASLSFTTAPGKLYSLQSSPALGNASNWTTVLSVAAVTGDGTAKTLSTARTTGAAFYRVVAQDQDTDGDGLSDWAERITGFDPASANTHGASEDDHTALTNDLVQENVVTVTATKPTATQPADAVTAASDTATITITRGGTLHFSAITVPLAWSGTAVSGVDYASLPTSVTFPAKVGVVTLTVTPLANTARRSPGTVTAVALPGGGYRIGSAHAASAVISPAGNANGTGLTGQYWNATSTNYTPYSPQATNVYATASTATRLDSTVDFVWSGTTLPPGINATYFLGRWKGQVQPQYSETYYFDVTADDGASLWVNGQPVITSWAFTSTGDNGKGDRLGSITLQAGVLYDIQLDYNQAGGTGSVHLFWYSNSQPRQVIPTARLYPATAAPAPPAITSATTAFGFVNQPFNFTVTASASGGAATSFALGANSGPLPAGLTLNATSGVISGTPTVPGDYQVSLTATNAIGTGASVLDIQILNAGSGVSRELWTGLAGTNISDIPLTTTPSSTDTSLSTPEDNASYANKTGERLRGYFVAPVTGNYYFWLAASNTAEFWLSDDDELANLTRRAWVTAPGTAAKSWTGNSAQTNQRSPWLALVAGQTYYYEVLHNTGATGSANNLAVGYLLDPSGQATTPVVGSASGVVPGYVLTKYDYPTTTAAAGTLYTTNLSPQGGSASSATGSANLRLLPGNTQAILHFDYSGLSTPRTAYHIHISPDQTGSGPIIFDLDDVDKFHPELKTADGGYIWNIVAVGTYSPQQIVTAIQGGTTYFNVHTVAYPNGEIRGFLTLVDGSQHPPTYVADPGFADDHATDAGAARFLNQAAYGAAPTDLAAVQQGGYTAWLDAQMALPATHVLPDLLSRPSTDIIHVYKSDLFQDCWWRAAVTAPDQLRQRVAFALSETMVTSSSAVVLSDFATSLASYYDTLADGAFGNFRDLLKAATLHPTMGYWLNMQGNAKGNLVTGLHPNENYAREIMQLFSIGLNRLWPDGSLVLDSTGNPVPTYNQDVITGVARVFTGWNYAQTPPTNGSQLTNFSPGADWTHPMSLVPGYHELGTKNLLDHVVLPAALGYSVATGNGTGGTQSDATNALCNTYCNADLDKALDAIFYHPNVGPFVCRQLIQRLVKSNPSPAYLYRVVTKFNDDGTAAHVRGNMTAVVKAILLDGEARNLNTSAAPSGKLREPIMRIAAPARTFLFNASAGTYSQSGPTLMNITLPANSAPNRLASGDAVALDFSVNDTGTPPVAPWDNPFSGNYTVASSPAPTATSFSVTAAGFASAGFTVTAPTTVTPSTNLIVKTGGPTSPAVGTTSVYPQVYLQFLPAGSGPDGVYTCGAPSGGNLQVYTNTAPSASATSVIMPKIQCAFFVDSPVGASTPNKVTIFNFVNANFKPGDKLWLDVPSDGVLPSGVYTVDTIVDETHFTVVNTVRYPRNYNERYLYFYPLQPLPQSRSGKVGQASSKFDMGGTDGSLAQTPLAAATVFNFFYPDYKYPGEIATANVTAPEFQITTDTNIINLTNTLNKSFLSSGNPNGLCSFNGGSIVFDLSPYMAAPYSVADTNGVTALVNKLGDLLTGGQLTAGTKTQIVNYITGSTVVSGTAKPNFPTTTSTNVRDRVRSIVQLIMISPEYAVQR